MATVKRTSGNLIIQTPFKNSVPSNITLDTDHLFVTGNLTVRGNITAISSNTQVITDNIITLNAGETGSGVSTLGTTSGIEIDRGSAVGGPVQLIWNESTSTWQISGVTPGSPGDGTQYLNIATTISGTALSAVVDDPNPVLGGNLNVDGRTIYGNIGVTLQGVVELRNANTVPNSAFSTSTILYANISGAGTTGLYVLNDQAINEELITKRRAFGFSLLL
jgi:hypothetical protein